MARRNLKSNPSFRDGTAYYTGVNGATLAPTTDYYFYGNNAMAVTKTIDNTSGIKSTDPISVVAGLPYAFSAYVRLPNILPASEIANLTLTVEWRNSINVVVSVNQSVVLSLTNDTIWYRLAGVWAAPAEATVAFVQVAQIVGGSAGAKFIVDAFLVEQSNYVGGYADNLSQSAENSIVNKALSRPVATVFNGLQLNADVTINDLVLNTIDEDGVIWICTEIEGWYGQSAPELPDIPRGTEDGSYDVSGRYQSRIITINGVFFPPSNEALGAARDRLVTAVNLVRKSGWLRTNEAPTKAASVRLSGIPQIKTVNARGRTEFSVGFRAGDPIKYEWNDSDPDGLRYFQLNADGAVGTLPNIGTADVTGLFTLTGPLGAGSTIYNAATNETMTTTQALRGKGSIGTISSVSVTNNIATIKTTAPAHLIVGDEIIVTGVGIPFDTVSRTATVLGTSDNFPYTINYALISDNQVEATAVGQVQLANNDVLTVDTYSRIVSFNGSSIGQRSKLATLTYWIKLAPGNNTLKFFDDIDSLTITTKKTLASVATLTASDIHYLTPGETVVVSLGGTIALARKSLTSNVVTLTTAVPHGFSIGDKISVNSTALSTVSNKSATTTVATLQTVSTNGIEVSDTIIVALPSTATPATKALTSNVATIATAQPHGFSAGDSVVVALPVTAAITNKALTSNQATLTTSTSHNYQIGDSITVALGTSAAITNKAKSGASAILTASVAHGFSAGDTVVVALPETATQTNTRSIAGAGGGYLATINTSAAHGFQVGDNITVVTGLTSTNAVSNRAATATLATLTIGGSAFSVGETIVVSGISSAQYNGTFSITAVTATTISYAGTFTTETSVVSTGSVANTTISTGYNGNKVIQTIPTSTSLTYFAWAQDISTASSIAGTGATLTDTTNVTFNGTKTLTSASGTQFTYNL